MISRYVLRNSRWISKATGKPMELPPGNEPCTPTIRSDIDDYISPIDGKRVASRSGQRYDLEKNDCVLAPPSKNKFNPEEYRWRKAQQAKQLERKSNGGPS